MIHLKKISRPKVSRKNNKSLRTKINDREHRLPSPQWNRDMTLEATFMKDNFVPVNSIT